MKRSAGESSRPTPRIRIDKARGDFDDEEVVKLRLLATCAVFALLLGQVGPFVHFVTVQHATCPEHGELIEVSPAAPHFSERSALPAYRGSAPEAHHTTDDHCEVALAIKGHDAVEPAPHLAQPAIASPFLAPRSIGPPEYIASISVYVLAPKSSPPRAV